MFVVKGVVKLAASLLFLMSAAAHAQNPGNCDRPAMPSIPNNASESLDSMLDAQDDVQEFMAASTAYVSCMDGAIERADPRQETSMAELVRMRNGNIDDQEAIAEAFNVQLRAYQASQQ